MTLKTSSTHSSHISSPFSEPASDHWRISCTSSTSFTRRVRRAESLWTLVTFLSSSDRTHSSKRTRR